MLRWWSGHHQKKSDPFLGFVPKFFQNDRICKHYQPGENGFDRDDFDRREWGPFPWIILWILFYCKGYSLTYLLMQC
jgi:hypothetical protein